MLFSELKLGDVTTVNMTMMSGGVQQNVVPNQFKVKIIQILVSSYKCSLQLGFDIRITPTTDIDSFEKQLAQWTEEAGGDIEMEIVSKFTDQTLTSVSDTDPWYQVQILLINLQFLNNLS